MKIFNMSPKRWHCIICWEYHTSICLPLNFLQWIKGVVKTVLLIIFNELSCNYMGSHLESSLWDNLAKESAGRNFKLKVKFLPVSMEDNNPKKLYEVRNSMPFKDEEWLRIDKFDRFGVGGGSYWISIKTTKYYNIL